MMRHATVTGTHIAWTISHYFKQLKMFIVHIVENTYGDPLTQTQWISAEVFIVVKTTGQIFGYKNETY